MADRLLQELVIPYRPKSWNSFAGAGKWAYRNYKVQARNDAELLCRAQKLKPMKGPVVMTFHYGFKTKRKSDITDICTKPFVDGIVNAGILEDDNRFIVVSTITTWEESDEDFLKIKLTPHERTSVSKNKH